LVRAASLFGDDPAALNARFWAAVAEYRAGRRAPAGDELKAVAGELQRRPAFKALRAQLAWQHGLAEGTQGRWPVALEQVRKARALFDELGETSNTGFLDALI